MNSDKLLDYIGWTLLIIASILLGSFGKFIDNIIYAKSFILEFSIYSLIISSAILLLIYRFNPNYFKSEDEKRGSAILSYFFGVAIIFLFWFCNYNINTANEELKKIKGIVVKKMKNTRYGTRYLKIKLGNKVERFQPNKKEWDLIYENDTIILLIGKGKLGYNYIFKFNNNN